MEKIKIGYFADGPWSHLAFEKIIKDKSITIGFIVPRSDSNDDTLKNYAKSYGIDYLQGINVNSDSFYTKANNYNCDLFVSMSFNQIFKTKIMNLPKLKTINCHAGKLPFYRGRNILNWALINDEKEFGITVHYIDEGIDTGDIILQNLFPINDLDNYETLLNKAYTGCSDSIYNGIKIIQNESVKPIKQNTIHPIGMYCGQRKKGDEIINWNQTSRQLFNFIRSITYPGPCAQSKKENSDVICKIIKAE